MTKEKGSEKFSLLRACIVLALTMPLAGCGGSSGGLLEGGEGDAESGDVNIPVELPMASGRQVVTGLAPGQSGHFSTDGQANGQATGNPADYGEHVDDQRLLYWNFQLKPGEFQEVDGRTPDFTPRDGVNIWLDDFGVPAVYADTVSDLWFGAGYIAAVQRLFLMDGVVRTAKGTLAELTGPATVPADIQQRILSYTEAEYLAIFDALPQLAKDIVNGYIAGANLRINEVLADPNLLPAEYTLLSSLPVELTISDVLASGVFITRFVAAEGGNEFENVQALQELEALHGVANGRSIFLDFFWTDEENAALTIPPSEARFTNVTTPAADRMAVFTAQADWAATLPLELKDGPGTGAAPEPSPAPLPLSTAQNSSSRTSSADGDQARAAAARAAEYLSDYLTNLHGGSYMAAIHGSKTASGLPILINGPQLGYDYPTQLVELEVHGAGFHARGATVPALPVVGIGFNENIVWGVTTGYSKTIDSFVVDTSVGSGPNQYLHDGQIKDMDCRTERINYRQAPMGVPAGPPVFFVDQEVCRTVHGPVVARTSDGNFARAVQYAMWMREIDTINGIIGWQMAEDLDDFHAAMAQVTWNENTMYAGADGNIAYYHPGLHPVRHPDTDQRLPNLGDGSQDHQGSMPFSETPQIINPAQGFIANWNNKPAAGWGDGIGGNAITLPAGTEQRVTNWIDILARNDNFEFADMLLLDRDTGTRDPRARAFVPLITAARTSGILTAAQEALADRVSGWDQYHYNQAIDITDENATDTPGATIFDVIIRQLRQDLFASVLPADMFDRMSRVGFHEYDASPMDNVMLRLLNPSASSIDIRFDYTRGRTTNEILRDAIEAARIQMEADFGSTNPDQFTRIHHRDEVCSLTGGVIGPCITMPHQDRGSWNHIVGFE